MFLYHADQVAHQPVYTFGKWRANSLGSTNHEPQESQTEQRPSSCLSSTDNDDVAEGTNSCPGQESG